MWSYKLQQKCNEQSRKQWRVRIDCIFTNMCRAGINDGMKNKCIKTTSKTLLPTRGEAQPQQCCSYWVSLSIARCVTTSNRWSLGQLPRKRKRNTVCVCVWGEHGQGRAGQRAGRNKHKLKRPSSLSSTPLYSPSVLRKGIISRSLKLLVIISSYWLFWDDVYMHYLKCSNDVQYWFWQPTVKLHSTWGLGWN